MEYRPRRSSQRWTEGAPEYILACYDGGAKFADRYSILFGGSLLDPALLKDRKVHGMTIGRDASCWCEFEAWRRDYGKHIKWLDIPEDIRKQICRAAEATD